MGGGRTAERERADRISPAPGGREKEAGTGGEVRIGRARLSERAVFDYWIPAHSERRALPFNSQTTLRSSAAARARTPASRSAVCGRARRLCLYWGDAGALWA